MKGRREVPSRPLRGAHRTVTHRRFEHAWARGHGPFRHVRRSEDERSENDILSPRGCISPADGNALLWTYHARIG